MTLYIWLALIILNPNQNYTCEQRVWEKNKQNVDIEYVFNLIRNYKNKLSIMIVVVIIL